MGRRAGRLRGLVRQFLHLQRPSGIYLEDLFVRPALRGKGIGKALLVHLARQCVANGWSRLQWSVLDWNTPSIEFYKSLGAVLMDEWTVCRVSGPALTALAQGSALMEIVLIVAVAENGVIGAGGAIPWRLKSDMQRFKAMTMGKPVVMGRKTFVSICAGRFPDAPISWSRATPDFRAAGAVVTTFASPMPRAVAHRRCAAAFRH